MDMIPLSVSARDAQKTAKQLRTSGHVPCVVYGNEVENMSLQATAKDLHKAFQKAGESTLVELEMEGKKIPVLFKDISFHPVSGAEMHADFYAVNMKEEIETGVPIQFEGESPAVKDFSAILVTAQDEVTVRCLPSNLPHALTVNLEKLKEFGDVITVADLTLPNGVTITNSADTVLATVQQPREEEVIAPTTPAEGADAAATAEGATPAEGAAEDKKGE